MESHGETETQLQDEASQLVAVSAENIGEDENDVLIAKAHSLIDKITANPDNPSPSVLHALSTLLETQEARYLEDATGSPTSNGRSSHNVGRLGNLIRENDEFFKLISSNFLTASRYSVSVRAASVRLLVSCSVTWMYPHIFDDDVLSNIRGWVMEEMPLSSDEECNSNHSTNKQKMPDSEMLVTYSTGLLAVCLASFDQLVEDVLTPGLSAKLMRYLRLRIFCDTNIHQKDGNQLNDRNNANTACQKAKDEAKVRLRQPAESSCSEANTLRIDMNEKDHVKDPCQLENPERGRERCLNTQPAGDEDLPDGECPPLVTCYQIGGNEGERGSYKESFDLRVKPVVKNIHEDDLDEISRDDSSRRRPVRFISKSRGKPPKSNDTLLDSGLPLTLASPCNHVGPVQTVSDKNASGILDLQGVSNLNQSHISKIDFSIPEREENDDCFKGCKVGSKDISDLVKKAVRAAEAEARAANASQEAVKVAGDDAAEMVKSVAFEEYNKLNDEDAAVVAASRTATAVVDAAISVAFSRNSVNADGDSAKAAPTEPEIDKDTEFVIPDSSTLGKLREKFCIQCLGPLGGYVDVLGPVLHEKGVDVCLSLLLRSSKDVDTLNYARLLPDILKLICALTAHKKFAAMFVDRGGIERLLSAPRNTDTFFGLSSCLHALGSSQGTMERVCALPSNILHQFVELALQLLDCQDHAARKNASSFFSVVFVFRAVIDAFDGQHGLQKLLSLLHNAALVRSGVAPGTSNNRASLRGDQSPAEVLTSSEKQIAYHTCVALCHYFRAHLLLLVDTIRPSKNVRNAPRNMSRVAYKPLDISNEAMNAMFRQIQKDRKLGPALVKPWNVVDNFLASNGHITILELCQAPPVEGHLHDLLAYALGVLHIVTLLPYSRKPIVNATLSNDRVGIAVILDLANGAGYVEPEVVVPALNVLINLVCPPPSISNKPSNIVQNQLAAAAQGGNVPVVESRDRNAERSVTGHFLNNHSQNELRERVGDPPSVDRAGLSISSSTFGSVSSPATVSTLTSGLVGDRRISLGAGTGGLAAQIEQGYRQARDAVRANHGIKVLLQLLQPRMVTSPAALDCLRALTCRVLLGLARDDAIAHILTKLQVGKRLSELIRDSGNQTSGGEQNRWQSELAQVAIELIGVVTNSGRASTLVASDAVTPTLRRIERAAIAAATPISYHSWELLLLIHEHLRALGLADSAATLLKEANLTPLPSLSAPSSLIHQCSRVEMPAVQNQWPCGRALSGFLVNKPKGACDSDVASSKKKHLPASVSAGYPKVQLKLEYSPVQSNSLKNAISQDATMPVDSMVPPLCPVKPSTDVDDQFRTPIILPKKRKAEMRDGGSLSSVKRQATGEYGIRSTLLGTPNSVSKSSLQTDPKLLLPSTSMKDQVNRPSLSTPNFDGNQLAGQISIQQGLINDQQSCGSERLTLDSLVVQYLKHQHRQCPAPITTLPPLSLLHPHVCPEPKRSLDAPSNVTSRLNTREFRSMCGGIHGRRKDRQFVYSRFRPWRTCRDDATSFLTCIAFLEDSSQIAVGGQSGELKVFESNNNNLLESCTSHQSPVTFLQSHHSGDVQLLLSSSSVDVLLWDASSVSGGPKHSFDGIKAARLNNSGSMFAALRPDLQTREILLYDVHTCQLDLTLIDPSTNHSGRGNPYSLIHFNQDSSRVLWNGVLWDYREPNPIHRFDKFTDYGGGGFHPAGNEVIINSEVWDLRTFRLLRSVPSLDQTVITFNGSGDVIYAILRRNFEDLHSALQPRRMKHPLYSAFRTVDAVNYSDIATIPVDRCVLDFATEPTDSFVGLINVDDQDEACSFARVFEIGRRKPTDDDSDPDDAESEEEEEEDDDDSSLEADLDEDMDDEEGTSGSDFDEEDGDFGMDEVEFDGGSIFEILAQGIDEDDDSDVVESYSSDDDDDEDED